MSVSKPIVKTSRLLLHLSSLSKTLRLKLQCESKGHCIFYSTKGISKNNKKTLTNKIKQNNYGVDRKYTKCELVESS